MTFFTVFFQMLALVIMIAAGVVATKTNLLDDHTATKLSPLIVHIFNPMLVLSSALDAAGQIPLPVLGSVALVALGMFLLFILVGMLITPFFSQDPQQRHLFQLMFVFSNLGFIGIPVVSSILGPEFVVYVTEFLLIYNLIFYTYGVALMEGRFSLSSLRSMCNFGNFITIFSLFVIVFGLRLPDFLYTAVSYLGAATSPLALVLVGYSLARFRLKQLLTDKRLYLFSFIKLILLPMAMLAVLKLLPLDDTLIPLFLVMFGMPVGNMPLMLGTQKGIDCTVCSAGIIMTTLLCVVTIPFLIVLA